MKDINSINSFILSKFQNSSYYAKRRNTTLGNIAPTYSELKYWSDKAYLTNPTQTYVSSEFDTVYSEQNSVAIAYNDVIGQSFYISAENYPNGLFLESIGLFFATTDTTSPITLEILPTVNGYPSSDNVIPLSRVTIYPESVVLPTTTNSLPDQTKFSFSAPVYLSPGVYVFTVRTNSKNVNLYLSERGKADISTGQVVINPYIGDFFQSQQGTTWAVDQTKDLCFVINRCIFDTGSTTFSLITNEYDNSFDAVHLKAINQDFGDLTSITYQLTSYDLDMEDIKTQNITPIEANKNIDLTNKQTLSVPASNGAIFDVTMLNTSNHISPILDYDSLKIILLNNNINSFSSNCSNSELTTSGWASAKYVTKTVTLADGFDSTGLTVYVDVNRQLGTDIEVFYRVLNQYDYSVDFNSSNWSRLPYYSVSNQGKIYTTGSEYTEESYQNLAISYTSNTGISYTNFKTFAVKVVMYSDNTAIVPKIKNLRVIATI